MKKRFVLSGYYGFKNFGDEAILSVLVEKIQSLNGQITVISSNPEYTKSKYNHIRSVYTFNFADIFAAIAKSDILISGGGSLLQDATSLKSLFYYLFIIFIGLLLRKKVIIFAQGIGPIKSYIGRFFVKYILKCCTYVSVRDDKSYELLNHWNIPADLLCDPFFSTIIADKIKEEKVAVQLRNFRTVNKDFIDRLALAVDKNFPDKKIEVYSLQDSIDLEICNDFANALKLLNPDADITVKSGLSDSEVIEGISKAEYLISMRFHAIIIGLLAGIKTMGINYDIKVKRLASEFLIPLIDLKNEFQDEFEKLKSQDTAQIGEIVKNKKFDWSGFERAIN